MTIEISARSENATSMRKLALLFQSFSLLRDGWGILFNDEYELWIERLRDMKFDDEYLEIYRRYGRDFINLREIPNLLDHRYYFRFPLDFYPYFLPPYLQHIPQNDDLEIISLEKGSITIVIKDIAKKLIDFLTKAIDENSDINLEIPNIRRIESEVGAGIVAMGKSHLQLTKETLQIENINFKPDDNAGVTR